MAVLLVAVTLLVYAPVRNQEFIEYDDNSYVTGNPHIAEGLSWEGISWGLTSFREGVWNPLTWWSFLLDYELFGMDPAGFHLTNLLLHLSGTLVLFFVLGQMTGSLVRSALVAALFALHPLSVESVAWVTERKNVLSALFWFLTMGAYLGYVRRPSMGRCLATLALLILGLITKPVLVTLPCVLLLLDYWPLGRLGESLLQWRRRLPSLILEKLLLMVPVALVSLVTIEAARSVQAMADLQSLSLGSRAGNALLSYLLYLKKILWPTQLAVFYPHPVDSLSPLLILVSCVLLVGISLLVWWQRRHGYLLVGWLWYLGTLFPTSGLFQTGGQAIADRFTYVPQIGIFLILVWGIADVLGSRPRARILPAPAAVVPLLLLALMTRSQLQYWQNSTTLFEHALRVTDNNHVAHRVLGEVLRRERQLQPAVRHFREAIRIHPGSAAAHNSLALALLDQGRLQEARTHLDLALKINPRFVEAHNNLGTILLREGDLAEAESRFLRALEIDSDFAEAHGNMGLLLAAQGDVAGAMEQYRLALRKAPDLSDSHNNLGVALMEADRVEEAVVHLRRALEINPDDREAHANLGLALARSGRAGEAADLLSRAVLLWPDFAPAHYYLGLIAEEQGDTEGAVASYRLALEYDPEHPGARRRLEEVQREDNP